MQFLRPGRGVKEKKKSQGTAPYLKLYALLEKMTVQFLGPGRDKIKQLKT